MAFKKIGIVCSLILFTISKVFPQSCRSVDTYTKYKSRKYCFLDTTDNRTHLTIPDLLQYMESQDTSLAKEIMQNGAKSGDYVSLFRQKGISIRAKSFNQFDALPNDTVLLTKREIRLKKKYDSLWSKISALIA